MIATLVGGPSDGRTVDLVGIYFAHLVAGRAFAPPRSWAEARYGWEMGAGAAIIGRFRGYYTRSGRKLKEPL